MASRLARFRPPALDLDILQEPPSKSEKVEQLFFALRHQTSQMHSESLDSPIEVYARFGDIECVKSSAVKVDGFKAPYLHANYVNFDTLTIKNAPQEILLSSNILTQYPIGPKEPLGFDTQEMFWKAALDHCHLIVDLTVKEEGMELYYPTELHHSKIQIGNISVTLTQVKKMDFGIEVHRYQVVDMNGQAEKEITRIHHSNWKDHQSVNELEQIEYLKALEDHISLQYPKQKTIVHCRAGVGRSGTYTVASALIELKRQGILEKANITHVIEKLILSGRTMRGPGFVQSKEQLECLLDLGEKLVERGLQEFKIDEQPIQDEEECKVESELDSIFELSVHFKIDRLESHPAYHFNLLQYPNEIVSVTADQIAQSACKKNQEPSCATYLFRESSSQIGNPEFKIFTMTFALKNPIKAARFTHLRLAENRKTGFWQVVSLRQDYDFQSRDVLIKNSQETDELRELLKKHEIQLNFDPQANVINRFRSLDDLAKTVIAKYSGGLSPDKIFPISPKELPIHSDC